MPDAPATPNTPAPVALADDPRLRRAACLDAQAVAKLLAVSVRTVRRMAERQELPAPVRIGPRLVRWRLADLERAIQGART